MTSQRRTGKKKPPDREPVLRATWLRVVELLGREGLVIGGKSMGGRIASLVADEAGVAGLVCLGYPFHPVGKPERLRVEHLQTIKTPTLIVQGERDPFGTREEVARYKLSPAIHVSWIEDGEHSFKPRKASGRTEQQNWEAAVGDSVTFLERLAIGKQQKRKRGCRDEDARRHLGQIAAFTEAKGGEIVFERKNNPLPVPGA